MPRDGSGIYGLPYPDVVDGTTIESAVHNGTMNDIEIDLNAPRPIVAGGTGASSALDARNNLDAEVSGAVVTNYDSHVWEAGSFYSAPGATSAPNASNYFSGICYLQGTLIILEAQAHSGTPAVLGDSFIRTKDGIGWSIWFQKPGSVTDLDARYDARYVNLTGDTMTGPLVLTGATPGGINIHEANGLTVGGGGDQGAIRFGNSGTRYIYWNTVSFVINGPVALPDTTDSTSPTTGALTVAGGAGVGGSIRAGGSIWSIEGGTTGTFQFGNSGLKYIYFDGTNFQWDGAPVKISNTAASTSSTTGALTVAGGIGAGGAVYSTNAIKVGTLVDTVGGRGFSFGVASSTDTGTGVSDITYSTAFTGGTTTVPVASVSTASTLNFCAVPGTPSASSIRIHCSVGSTAVLTDPQYFLVHVMGS